MEDFVLVWTQSFLNGTSSHPLDHTNTTALGKPLMLSHNLIDSQSDARCSSIIIASTYSLTNLWLSLLRHQTRRDLKALATTTMNLQRYTGSPENDRENPPATAQLEAEDEIEEDSS